MRPPPCQRRGRFMNSTTLSFSKPVSRNGVPQETELGMPNAVAALCAKPHLASVYVTNRQVPVGDRSFHRSGTDHHSYRSGKDYRGSDCPSLFPALLSVPVVSGSESTFRLLMSNNPGLHRRIGTFCPGRDGQFVTIGLRSAAGTVRGWRIS